MSSQEKTEKATPKKRRDERKKGNVFQSKDIVTVASIAIAFYFIKLWMPHIFKFMSSFIKKYFTKAAYIDSINNQFVIGVFADISKMIILIAGILMFLMMLVGVVGSGAQTKFLFSKEAFKIKFSKLDPLKGLKKMFSLKSAVEVIKNLLKISVLGLVVYNIIIKNIKYFPKLVGLDLLSSITLVFNIVMSLVNSIIIYFIIMAVIDYLYQWWEYEKNIKMSKQEVKDEYKNIEGNPEIKGKRKDRQRRMAMSRMMQQVPEADVIVRNPTHFAIAIKYDVTTDRAPIVIAKGKDYVAQKIINIASQNNIYMIENRPLARALYKEVDLNREVPIEYYEPIAEILAWVYRLKEKGK